MNQPTLSENRIRLRPFTGPMSSPRTNRLRAKLYLAQRGCCGICGRKLKSLLHCTIEHVQAQSSGAKSEGNRVVAHRSCNEGKGDRDPTGCEKIWLEAANAGLAT